MGPTFLDSLGSKARSFGIFLLKAALLTAPLFASHWVLRNFFSSRGEAYFKGEGHLLHENLVLGLFVLMTDQFFLSTLLAFWGLSMLEMFLRKRAYIALLIGLGVVTLVVLLVYAPRLTEEHYSFLRSLDIILTWVCRLVGAAASVIVLRKDEKFSNWNDSRYETLDE